MRKPVCFENYKVQQEEEYYSTNNKGAWSKQEDQRLIDYIETHGEGCWSSLPLAAGLHRGGKSCRLRWINYLRPDRKRAKFGEDEEDLIIKLHALLGNRWSLIAGRLPGRTENEVKNYWNSHLRKKLISMGIDPNNHRLKIINNNNISRLAVDNARILQPKNNHARRRHDEPIMMRRYDDNGAEFEDQVSDAISFFRRDKTGPILMLDLNLDLSLSTNIPSPTSLSNCIEEAHQNHEQQVESKLARRDIHQYLKNEPSPTLLLFN